MPEPLLLGGLCRGGEFSLDLRKHPRQRYACGLARIAVAIEALTVEICRPPIPSWTVGPVAMRNISAAPHGAPRAGSGKLSAAERSSLNQALAKALAFRDAGKMPEAREWAAELVRLLKSHAF